MSEFSCGFLEFFFRGRVRRGSCKDGRLIESFPFIELALGLLNERHHNADLQWVEERSENGRKQSVGFDEAHLSL